jgi:hypothetical protein
VGRFVDLLVLVLLSVYSLALFIDGLLRGYRLEIGLGLICAMITAAGWYFWSKPRNETAA